MASCFQHINECLYVVKSQLRSHWAYYREIGGVKLARTMLARIKGPVLTLGDHPEIAPAYELATVMEKPGARDVVLQAAQNLAKRKDGPITKGPAAVLKHLLTSLDRSRSFTPLRRQYNVGAKGQVVVSRNPKGKVTLAFPKGLGAGDGEALKTVLDQILRDLG